MYASSLALIVVLSGATGPRSSNPWPPGAVVINLTCEGDPGVMPDAKPWRLTARLSGLFTESPAGPRLSITESTPWRGTNQTSAYPEDLVHGFTTLVKFTPAGAVSDVRVAELPTGGDWQFMKHPSKQVGPLLGSVPLLIEIAAGRHRLRSTRVPMPESGPGVHVEVVNSQKEVRCFDGTSPCLSATIRGHVRGMVLEGVPFETVTTQTLVLDRKMRPSRLSQRTERLAFKSVSSITYSFEYASS